MKLEKIENLPEIYEIYLHSVIRLNYETIDLNYRKESEQHFTKVLELLYYRSRIDPERKDPEKKKNIAKTISIFEEIIKFHQKICQQRGAWDSIKLEFDTQINEQNDEIQAFKVSSDKILKFIWFIDIFH